MKQLYFYKNQDPSSFIPTKQLSINNEGWFFLTKVLKLHSKVSEQKINSWDSTLWNTWITPDKTTVPL